MYQTIKTANKHLEIKLIDDQSFKKYGKIIEGYDFSDYTKYAEEHTPIPQEGNVYVASCNELEALQPAKLLSKNFYGNMPLQVGYCNGNTFMMNALEYHKGSEIDIAVTDLVLLLGCIYDIENNTYSSDKVEAFYMSKGTAVELYGTTLHFAPCRVTETGYQCIIVLPRDTNCKIDNKSESITKEDKLLFMQNKWLIAHPDSKPAKEKGAYAGIYGENLKINIK